MRVLSGEKNPFLMVHKKESGGLFRLYKRSALLGHPLPTTTYLYYTMYMYLEFLYKCDFLEGKVKDSTKSHQFVDKYSRNKLPN